MSSYSLKKRIMARVYVLFWIGKLKNPLTAQIFICGASLLTISYLVSLRTIFAGTPHDLVGIYHFWTSAFINTEMTTKALILTLVLTGLIIGKRTTGFVYENTSRFLARA